jgi:hypothetical protein
MSKHISPFTKQWQFTDTLQSSLGNELEIPAFASIPHVPNVPTLSYEGSRHKSTETLFREYEVAMCPELREVWLTSPVAFVDSNLRITLGDNETRKIVACALQGLAEFFNWSISGECQILRG